MEWGPHLKYLLKMQSKGAKVSALETRPDTYDDLTFVWSMWESIRLTLDDNVRASWTDVQAFLDVHKIEDPEDRAELADLVLTVDREFVRLARKKTSADTSSSNRRKTSSSRGLPVRGRRQ